jgi:hypothetical protein
VPRDGDQKRPDRGRGHAAGESERGIAGEELRACMDAGADAASARTEAVARRAQWMIRAFAEDDPRVIEAPARIRGSDLPRGLAGWDAELFRYLHAALAHLEQEKDEP